LVVYIFIFFKFPYNDDISAFYFLL